MQHPDAEVAVTQPNRAAAAYGGVVRQTESPRKIEYEMFCRVTDALQLAERPGVPFAARIEAVHRNRELWQTLACDLASEENLLPDQLRASLIGLTFWVTRESTRVMRGLGASLADLIQVNHIIMQGLRPVPHEAA